MVQIHDASVQLGRAAQGHEDQYDEALHDEALHDEVRYDEADYVVPARRDNEEERLRHDLRQSLSAVMMLAAVADRQPLDGQAIRDTFGLMAHEVDWMAQVVGDLDEHAGQEPGGHTLVDIGEVVEEAWSVNAQCGCCSIRLTRDSDVVADVDPVGLRRSVQNLVDNAVRAAGPSGHVELRVLQHGATVAVEVADDGPGFGRIARQHGLGLQTVRRFAEENAAQVVIGRSELGGALVGMRIPRQATTSPDAALATKDSA